MSALIFLRRISFHGYRYVCSNTKRYSTVIPNQSYSIDFKMVRPFNIDNYDCVGFDLDNTLCEYKLDSLVRMEYNVMADFLIKKGYNREVVAAPVEAKELDFMQRGLLLDFEKGNILKLNNFGEIVRACHGTKVLSGEEILATYGERRRCATTADFTNDMTMAWEPPLVNKLRALLDFFDMPASLAFARCVDIMDSNNQKNYTECGQDIVAALQDMYAREHFTSRQGSFFSLLRKDPDLYINKCSDLVINWLQELNKSKIVFLVTGSNADNCHFTATHCLGSNWRDLFDTIICYARKPGFFKDERPFFATKDFQEAGELQRPEMGKILSQGNWNQFYHLLAKSIGKSAPLCLYFGDNLAEDIYAPSKWGCCDTAAVVEEKFRESERWGSFTDPNMFWGNVLQKHSLTYVSSLRTVAAHSLNEGVPYTIEQESNFKGTKQ